MLMIYYHQIIHLQSNIRALLLHLKANQLEASIDLVHNNNLTIMIACTIIATIITVITITTIILDELIKEKINIDNHSALT